MIMQTVDSRQQRRNVYLDTVKGTAIFLVVLGHCIEWNSNLWLPDDLVFKTIYSFHMPLFSLVSGYLFYSSFSHRTPREITAKQAQSLLLPVLSWTLILRILELCVKLIEGSFPDYEYMTLGLIFDFLSGFWFLWAMFWCSLAVIIAERFFHGNIAFYLFTVVLSLFVPRGFHSNLHAFVYPYFVVGYIWHREGFDTKINALPSWLKISGSIAVTVAWLVMLAFFDRNSYIYTGGICIVKYEEGIFVPYQIWTDIFRWAIGFAGSCCVMILLKLVKPVKILALVGTKTIGIYIISVDVLIVRGRLPRFEHTGYIIDFAEAVIITVLCYALTIIISRNKILNKFLLGGR